MLGVIDVGGGLRGAYGAGVFDKCLELGINFDYCIGVSAGSANIATFLGKQSHRTIRFYTQYSLRPEYMSFDNLRKKGSYVDLDYVYSVLSNDDGEDPLDFDTLSEFEGIYKIVVTDAKTGEAVYLDKKDLEKNDYTPLKASCCLPVACKPIHFKGVDCFDGGIADPVPVRKAFLDGCDKVVLILTRPADGIKKGNSDTKAATLLNFQYPEAAKRLADRYIRYNTGVSLAKEYEKRGKALILAPQDISGLKTLTKDVSKIENLYQQGFADAQKILSFINE